MKFIQAYLLVVLSTVSMVQSESTLKQFLALESRLAQLEAKNKELQAKLEMKLPGQNVSAHPAESSNLYNTPTKYGASMRFAKRSDNLETPPNAPDNQGGVLGKCNLDSTGPDTKGETLQADCIGDCSNPAFNNNQAECVSKGKCTDPEDTAGNTAEGDCTGTFEVNVFTEGIWTANTTNEAGANGSNAAQQQIFGPSDFDPNSQAPDTSRLQMIPFGKHVPREAGRDYLVATGEQECMICEALVSEAYVMGPQYVDLFGYHVRGDVNVPMGHAQARVLQSCPEFVNDWCYQDLGGTQALRSPCPHYLKCHYCLGINPLHCMHSYGSTMPLGSELNYG
eukprot:g4531.t1